MPILGVFMAFFQQTCKSLWPQISKNKISHFKWFLSFYTKAALEWFNGKSIQMYICMLKLCMYVRRHKGCLMCVWRWRMWAQWLCLYVHWPTSIHPHVLAAPFSSIAMKYQQDAIMHQNTIYTGVGQKNWNTWFYYTIIC